jgi:HSP20 family protein
MFGLLAPNLRGMSRGWMPAVDIVPSEEGTLYKLDMPGVSREDVHVQVESGRLVVRGERKSEVSRDGYCERSWGRFERSLPLPEGAEEDKISCQLTDGVLQVSVPHSDERESRREIPIN